MKYIYESPDKGKTVYRTPIGVPHAKRELVEADTTIEIEGLIIPYWNPAFDGQEIPYWNPKDDPGYPGLPANGKQS